MLLKPFLEGQHPNWESDEAWETSLSGPTKVKQEVLQLCRTNWYHFMFFFQMMHIQLGRTPWAHGIVSVRTQQSAELTRITCFPIWAGLYFWVNCTCTHSLCCWENDPIYQSMHVEVFCRWCLWYSLRYAALLCSWNPYTTYIKWMPSKRYKAAKTWDRFLSAVG